MRSATRKRVGKNPKYLDWIRTLPCVCCCVIDFGRMSWLIALFDKEMRNWEPQPEVAHVGERGLSQKCSDDQAIPLCGEHHRTGKDSHHVLGKKFWSHWGIDRDKLLTELRARYEAQR